MTNIEDYANKRVLIVDDQKEIHQDFEEMLKPGSSEEALTDELASAFIAEEKEDFLPEFELVHASGGEEACETVRAARESNRPIAVAFIDIRMPPGIDGVETIRRIRKIDRQVEVVIMTAYTDKALPDIIQDLDLLHKILYIRKPFAREEIQQITLSLAGKWNIEQTLAEKQRELTANHERLEAVLDATGDAMAMYDDGGSLMFANREYEELFGMTAGELKETAPEVLEAQFKERFQEPSVPELEGRFFLEWQGRNKKTSGEMPKRKLFYRSTAPVRDNREGHMGRLIVYRDVSREIEIEQMKSEVLRLRSELQTTYSFAGMVGNSAPMQEVYALMKQAAESDITVLIRGESGTGKELVAKSFHYNSLRREGRFLAVNCAALPDGMIESELFGHEKGAFTGAEQQRLGAFELAAGGTLFLDEVGDMHLDVQAKLLRVLQERQIRRLGGSSTLTVDVRVIAATNKDLEKAVSEGSFREDLFFRLAAFPVAVPPLRERREDIPLLANHFLKKYAELNDKSISGFSNAALRALLQHDWPGNVRELENAVERAVLLEAGGVLQVYNLPSHLALPPAPGDDRTPAVLTLVEVERRAMDHALEVSAGNVAAAAQALGVNRATLYRKLKKYGLLERN